MKRPLQFVTLLFLTLLIGVGSSFQSTVNAAASFTVSTNSINAKQLVFSSVGSNNSLTQNVRVTNTTGGNITVTAAKSGADAAQFTITAGSTLNLSGGAFGNVTVRFAATSSRVYVASLGLTFGAETETVELRGVRIPTANGGNDEASFQRVLNAYNFAVNSGDNNEASTNVHDAAGGSAPLLGDEIPAQLFEKAGAGPVQVQLMGNFLQDKTPDAGSLGWYPANLPNSRTEIFKVNAKSGSPSNNNHQSLQALTTPAGVNGPNFSFDPGSTVFGMYGRYTKFVGNVTDRYGYSQDIFNTWDTIPETHKMRVYPLRTSTGVLVENAYIITTEDYDVAFDFNDLIFILRNVKPAGAGTADADPVVRLESRDWLTFAAQNIPLTEYWDTMLLMTRVQRFKGEGFKDKDVSTLRIFNDGGSTLIVNTIAITGTNIFSLPNGETSLSIPSGGFYDLVVKYVETIASDAANIHYIRKETLTLTTNVGVYTAPLVGGFQNYPQNANELTAQEVINAVGFTTNMGGFKSKTSMAGESWYPAGQEVLSKYWKLADPSKPIHIRQLASLQGCCPGANVRLNFPSYTSTSGDPNMTGGRYYVQSLLPPNGEFITGAPTEMTVYNTNVFEVVGPSNSRSCSGFENTGATPGCGLFHGIRWWPARDAQGWLIPGTFFIAQDYVGTGDGNNFDYNDNLYMITNVQPDVSQMHPSRPQKPDLALTVASIPASSRVGRDTIVRFTVRNIQPFPSSNVNLTITMPTTGVQLLSAPGCTGTAPTLTCALGDFIAGDLRYIDLLMEPTTTGDKIFSGQVTTPTAENATGNNSASVIIPVGEQTAPTAVNDSYEMVQDTTLNMGKANGVLKNDTDPNSDPLTAAVVDLPDHAVGFNLKPNGAFLYTPAVGYIGTDTFSYMANDGSDDSNVATVTITINRLNYVPETEDDDYTTPEDTPLVVNAANGILANDSDGNDDPLTISIIDQPTHANSLTVNPDGSFTYVPADNYNGLDTFTYRVNDTEADSNVSTVTITITSVGDTPVANNDVYDTDENVTLTVNAAAGVLANDTDGDGDALKASVLDTTDNGSLTLNLNGSFTYIPDNGFQGSDTFTYTVTDDKDGSDEGTVTINIAPDNRAPVIVTDKYDTFRDETLTVDASEGVLANDTDADGDTLTAQLVTVPDGVDLSLNTDGSFTYVPNTGFEGTITFTYRALDGKGGTAIGLAKISVSAPPTTPSDLVYNGGFEQKSVHSKTMPQGWTTKRLTADRLRCNTNKKTFSYAGECAFRFVGAANKNTLISQRPNIDIVEAGDTLRLSLFAKGYQVPKDKAIVKVIIKYMDSGLKNGVVTQKLPKQTYDFTSFGKEILVEDEVNWIKVQISYKGAKGLLTIDNISLRVIKPGVQYTDSDGSLLRGSLSVPAPQVENGGGLIPLPAAPQDMRGN